MIINVFLWCHVRHLNCEGLKLNCLQCFSSEKVLLEIRKDCLLINGGQKVKLKKGFIEFKNYNRQIPAPF